MAIVLHQTGRLAITQAAGVTTYYWAGSGPASIANTTETNRQVVIRTAGTASKLYINLIANDRGASTLTFRKNAGDGTQAIAITAATAGKFEDASGTDALVAGDLIGYQLVTGSGGSTFTFNAINHLFASGTNTSQRLVAHWGGSIGGGTEFIPLSGAASGSADSAMQTKIYGNGGTFKNLAVYSSANARDGDTPFTLRNGAVDQSLTITIPASTAGWFEDTSNSVAAVSGDLFCWAAVRGGSAGTLTVQGVMCDYETTDRTFLMSSFGTTNVGAGTTVYLGFNGSYNGSSATETDAQSEARTPFTLSNLRVQAATNGVNEATTVTLRKNTSDATLTISITGLTAGGFEDVTNSDAIIATDLLDLKVVVGATGTTLLIRNATMLATIPEEEEEEEEPASDTSVDIQNIETTLRDNPSGAQQISGDQRNAARPRMLPF